MSVSWLSRRYAGARLREERGQVLVFAAIGMVALLGFAGLSIDLGSWYHQQRSEQATADAAALAGAQDLPDDPSGAAALAMQYANENGAGLSANDIVISGDRTPNDTISVRVGKEAPALFTKLFGVNSVTVHAGAAARSDGVSEAEYVAPVAVSSKHPMLGCAPPPCAGATQLDMVDLKAPGGPNGAGNFSLLDLTGSGGGSIGDSTLAGWLSNGYDAAMPLGIYDGVPGTKFNSGSFRSALDSRIGQEVLFPVYKPPIVKSGSNAQFNIIGWVGFLITGSSGGGNSGTIYGQFKRYIAQGLQATNPGSQSDFGVRAVQLVQ
jgi:Flp pilus assembly protein TadG